MKTKKVFYIILLVFLSLLFTACPYSSKTTVLSIENNTPTSAEMSYKDFNGTINRDIVVSSGETCEVSFQITTESGNLNLSLTGQDGNEQYKGSNVTTSNFSVTLTAPQTYTLTIKGDHHSGSYKIAWQSK
jgi:hypothetical protein